MRQWPPAGTLASRVLRFSRVVKTERWAQMPETVWELAGEATDEGRLRQVLPDLGPLTPSDKLALQAARQFVDVTEFVDRAHAAGLVRAPGQLVRVNALGREALTYLAPNGMAFLVTPAEAIYLSTAAGFARQTLGICGSQARDGGCARLFAAPRVGFAYKFCDDCRQLGRSTRMPRGAETLGDEKRRAWKRVYGRQYKRQLRDEWAERGHRPVAGRQLRRTRKRLHPARQQTLEAWRLPALNALLETDDMQAWEARWAPKERPGRKPRHTEKEIRPYSKIDVSHDGSTLVRLKSGGRG